jgi:tripartite-type tricarboxylate transporter receptor subunit TctC
MAKVASKLCIAACALGMAAAAYAQEFPGKPIHLIVPFTAGSATDIIARVLGERLSADFGQPVMVENRPGAGGTIGITLVAKAAPDGITLGVVSTGHVVNDTLYKDLQYETLGDFAGVAPLASLPSVLIVPPDPGVRRVSDLVALARRRPGELNYATAGIGSASHINSEKFRLAAGINVLHIPLKGTPEILSETMGGRVQMAWVPLVSAIGPIKDGKVVALAVSTGVRSPTLPDVPTIAEAGYPDAAFNFWVGLLAPAKTPRAIVTRLNAEVARALRQPEVRSRLANLGAEPMFMTAEKFDAFLSQEHDVLGKVMREAGVPSR